MRLRASLALVVGAVLVVGASFVVLGSPSASAATPDAAIRLPYLGSDTRPVPRGWTVTACPRGAQPDLVSLTCDDDEITFRATDYDRGLTQQSVTVAFTASGRSRSRTYSLSLTGPELRVRANDTYRYPLPQGTPTTIPYTTFRPTCQACASKSPQFRSGSVSPSSAGSARFSGTGLVFSPSPDFSGVATVHYRVRDRYGQQSDRASLRVTVVPGRSHAPTTVPLSAEVLNAAQTASSTTLRRATGDAMANDIGEKKYPAILSSCGTPFHGTVVCKADGSYTYTPAKGFSGVDEFGYHVFVAKSGDQAVGTVLVRVTRPGRSTPSSSAVTAALTSPRAAQKTPILTPRAFSEGT